MTPLFPQLLLRVLLHLANSDPPTVGRREFYALKDRLLDRYATRVGAEIQEIEQPCYGWGRQGCDGHDCPKCGGTGIWERVWVLLHRYRWGRYVFHRPGQRSWTRPPHVHIRGRIQHRRYGRAAAEAALWLYIFTGEWALLALSLRASRRFGWWLWPLLNLQRVVFEVAQSRRARRNRRDWALIRAEREVCDPDADLPF